MSAMPSTIPADISRQALSVARIVERLPPGEYTINIIRPERKTERWTIEVHRIVLAQRELIDHAPEENNNDGVTTVTP